MRKDVFGDVVGRLFAVVPGLERNEYGRGVGLVGAGDDVEARHEKDVLHRGMLADELLHGRADLLRALQGRAVGGKVTDPIR